jgi:DNA-binding response OmpR family regulator
LFSLVIIANETDQARRLSSEISQRGYVCSVSRDDEDTLERVMRKAPSLVCVHMDGSLDRQRFRTLCQKIRQEKHIPVIAIIPREMLDSLSSGIDIDDFVVGPCEATELAARVRRILGHKASGDNEGLVRCGDLAIDPAKYEVSVGNRPITLTFREYQLLLFLASNDGKVFTREALLDKVWGWDYYGGDRTVDVHIRRLRSKIEDGNHSFIETVRNIGYRFRAT